MIVKRADVLHGEKGSSKVGREDLEGQVREIKYEGPTEVKTITFGDNEEFDYNFENNSKNTHFINICTLQRDEDETEFFAKAEAKKMLSVILNPQEHSIPNKSQSKSDSFSVCGLYEDIEEKMNIICEDSEEDANENDNQIKQSRQSNTILESDQASTKFKCGDVILSQEIIRKNEEKTKDFEKIKGHRKTGKRFSGWSKYKRIFITYVWLLTTMTAVSAAPSFFDRIGRSSFDPFKCGCSGGGSKRARVVGGSELSQGSAPWLAAITKGGKSHCGAALVSRDHLLTAAHCIDGLHLDDLRGWLGAHALSDAQSSGNGMKFRHAYSHPNFEYSGFHNDIAIMELQNSVHFSSSVRPVCLPSRADVQYASRTAMVAGWGRTAENGPPSDIPRQALVQVWTKAKCRGAGYPAKRVAGEVLCAGLPKGGVDACQGDSGGPLVLEGSHGSMEVIGVVSWGRGCARPNLPGIYTRVASYLSFIQNIIEQSCS